MIVPRSVIAGIVTLFFPLFAQTKLETTFELTKIDTSYEKITATVILDDHQPSIIHQSDDLLITVEIVTSVSEESESLAFITYTVSHKETSSDWEILARPSLVAEFNKPITRKSESDQDTTTVWSITTHASAIPLDAEKNS